MSSFLPVGLTYLLPSNGNTVTLAAADIQSDTGKVGPLLLRISNADNTNTAVVTYSNELTPLPPPPPVLYSNINVSHSGGAYAQVEIVIVPGFSATLQNPTGSTSSWQVSETFIVPGDQIGGTTPENDLTFFVTGTDPMAFPGDYGKLISADYYSGVIPGTPPGPSPDLPTYNVPTKVVTISPLTTEYVQIPSSGQGDTTLYCSGADVYVTPVQIVA